MSADSPAPVVLSGILHAHSRRYIVSPLKSYNGSIDDHTTATITLGSDLDHAPSSSTSWTLSHPPADPSDADRPPPLMAEVAIRDSKGLYLASTQGNEELSLLDKYDPDTCRWRVEANEYLQSCATNEYISGDILGIRLSRSKDADHCRFLLCPARLEGWLQKKGSSGFKSYQKRFFRFEGGVLSYYHSYPNQAHPKGAVSFDWQSIVRVSQSTANPLRFDVEIKEPHSKDTRKLELMADDMLHVGQWVSALKSSHVESITRKGRLSIGGFGSGSILSDGQPLLPDDAPLPPGPPPAHPNGDHARHDSFDDLKRKLNITSTPATATTTATTHSHESISDLIFRPELSPLVAAQKAAEELEAKSKSQPPLHEPTTTHSQPPPPEHKVEPAPEPRVEAEVALQEHEDILAQERAALERLQEEEDRAENEHRRLKELEEEAANHAKHVVATKEREKREAEERELAAQREKEAEEARIADARRVLAEEEQAELQRQEAILQAKEAKKRHERQEAKRQEEERLAHERRAAEIKQQLEEERLAEEAAAEQERLRLLQITRQAEADRLEQVRLAEEEAERARQSEAARMSAYMAELARIKAEQEAQVAAVLKQQQEEAERAETQAAAAREAQRLEQEQHRLRMVEAEERRLKSEREAERVRREQEAEEEATRRAIEEEAREQQRQLNARHMAEIQREVDEIELQDGTNSPQPHDHDQLMDPPSQHGDHPRLMPNVHDSSADHVDEVSRNPRYSVDQHPTDLMHGIRPMQSTQSDEFDMHPDYEHEFSQTHRSRTNQQQTQPGGTGCCCVVQ